MLTVNLAQMVDCQVVISGKIAKSMMSKLLFYFIGSSNLMMNDLMKVFTLNSKLDKHNKNF